jgi:hypothetical protein
LFHKNKEEPIETRMILPDCCRKIQGVCALKTAKGAHASKQHKGQLNTASNEQCLNEETAEIDVRAHFGRRTVVKEVVFSFCEVQSVTLHTCGHTWGLFDGTNTR